MYETLENFETELSPNGVLLLRMNRAPVNALSGNGRVICADGVLEEHSGIGRAGGEDERKTESLEARSNLGFSAI